MRPGGGHAKGAAFERQVCEQLSRWIDPEGDDTHFWRSSMSGGRATIRGRQGKRTASQSSDISAITSEGIPFLSIFSVECKFVRDLNIQAGAVSAKGSLADYWQQVSRDAAKHGKRPLLIARQNQWPPLVFMRTQDSALFSSALVELELCRFLAFHGPSLSMYLLDQLLETDYIAGNFSRRRR